MPDFIEVACPCGRKLRATPEQVGTSVRCWSCRSDVPVPSHRMDARIVGAFGSAVRDMLRLDALGVMLVAALVVSVLLMTPYVGNVIGFAALVVGARLYQVLIRDSATSARALAAVDRDQTGENDEPERWFSWTLAVLAATAFVAPFILRQLVGGLPISLRWALVSAGFASWLIVPLVVLAVFARDRRGPVPPRVLLGTLVSHPLATLAAVLILPVGFVLVEFGIAMIARGEDRLPSLVQDLYPQPVNVVEGRDIVFRYQFDDATNIIRHGTLPEMAYPIYLTGLRRGYTLIGSIPSSLSRHLEYMIDSRTRYVSNLPHHGTLAALILAAGALILSLQARWLGLVASLGSCRPVTATASPLATVHAIDDLALVGAPPSRGALVTASASGPVTATTSEPSEGADVRPGFLFPSIAQPRPAPHSAWSGAVPTLLVVDSHRGFAAGLGRVLSSHGFAVLFAGTASEASALVQGARPDLVVLDMQLPDRSAFEFCHELRENGPAPGRPILIATSATATPDEIAAMARMADDHLIKPYAIDALVSRIKQHLALRAAREAVPLLNEVISGGQSETDQAGGRAARAAGIPTEGRMPLGYLTEDGPRPEVVDLYRAAEKATESRRARTEENARRSDATLWFGSTDTPGAKPADLCWLNVVIRGETYTARPVRPESGDVVRAWRLRKPDGTSYTVADTLDGVTCECGDLVYRLGGVDQTGCKHVRALRALGLIDPEGTDPADWPAWTDTHAFAVAR